MSAAFRGHYAWQNAARWTKKPSVALIRHESGQDPASDTAKPIPKPAFAVQLCPDAQSDLSAIAHLSHFWPRTQQIARKSHALRPVTRTRKRKQGDGGVLTAMRRAPKMPTRTRLFPPYPTRGGKHPRRRDARERQAPATTRTSDNGKHPRRRDARERPATRNTSQPQRGCTGG